MSMNKRIFGNELKYLREVLDTEFRSSSGSIMTQRLEKQFSELYGSDFSISFINGTATMHAALEAYGIGEGDEVIVPPLTMSSTAFCVLQANATPVFADVDYNTFQISAESIKNVITPKTRAIITVALYGLCPDMDPINALAKTNGLMVIEDNAQSVLSKYKNKLVGKLGDCASFSFQSSKHITSGEGGMIITDNPELAENIRKVQSLGYAGVSAKKGKITKLDIQDPGYSRHVQMGWNYRMPELCAAVALAQLENVDDLVTSRINVAKLYNDVSSEFDWFKSQYVDSNYRHSYWTWAAYLDRNDITWHQIRDKFRDNGGDGVYAAWMLSYMEPMFKTGALLGRERYISKANMEKYTKGLCPIAEKLQPRLFQFKTNYWDITDAEKQADALYKTLKCF